MKANCFGPTVARIDADDELTFRNVDEHAHTVGGVAGTFGDAHKEVPAGESVPSRFDPRHRGDDGRAPASAEGSRHGVGHGGRGGGGRAGPLKSRATAASSSWVALELQHIRHKRESCGLVEHADIRAAD